MTELSTLTEWFQREVAVPGTFADTFPSFSEQLILDSLADAFAAAQLDGYFPTWTLDLADYTTAPDLSLGAQALVVLYAGERLLRQQLLNLKSLTRYKAGPVEYEVQQSSTILRDLLAAIAARKAALLDAAKYGDGTDTVQIDGFYGRGSTTVAAWYPGNLPAWSPGELPAAYVVRP